MVRLVATALLIVLSSLAFADWSVGEGELSVREGQLAPLPPKTGMVAAVEAKAPDRGVTARLHAECFNPNSEIALRAVFVVLSEEMATGPLGYRYRFDEGQTRTVLMGLPSETRLTRFLLGDASSANFHRLTAAKRLRLTLMPTNSAEFSFDFDVTGSETAIKSIPCKEFGRSN